MSEPTARIARTDRPQLWSGPRLIGSASFHAHTTVSAVTYVSLLSVVVSEPLPVISPTGHKLQTCQEITHTHTHPFNGRFSGLPGWAGTRKVKPVWILLKQVTVSGTGISWAICKSAPRSRQITTPAPHYSVFSQAGCPSCRPTNSVKGLKAHFKKSLKGHNNV